MAYYVSYFCSHKVIIHMEIESYRYSLKLDHSFCNTELKYNFRWTNVSILKHLKAWLASW